MSAVSDPILLALLHQLMRRDVLSDMDVQAMAADLERAGHMQEAHSINVAWIEACALGVDDLDGGNEGD